MEVSIHSPTHLHGMVFYLSIRDNSIFYLFLLYQILLYICKMSVIHLSSHLMHSTSSAMHMSFFSVENTVTVNKKFNGTTLLYTLKSHCFIYKVCLFHKGTLSVPTQGVLQVPTQNRQSIYVYTKLMKKLTNKQICVT
jgi:hypothetical protein